MEYVPFVLNKWLVKNTEKLDSLINQVTNTISFLRKNKIIHFDVHFGNLVTDGDMFFLTDFGLTLDMKFDLSEAEKRLFRNNLYYDYAEFLTCIGFHYFSINKENKKVKEFMNNSDDIDKQFISFMNNLELLNKKGILGSNQKYLETVNKYHEIIMFFNNFYTELSKNEKKDNTYSQKKLKSLLQKAGLI